MKQIIELFCLFCKPADDTENIYDVPSTLLRKISDHTLGNLFVSLSVCIFFRLCIDVFFICLKLSAQRSSRLRRPTGGYEAWSDGDLCSSQCRGV